MIILIYYIVYTILLFFVSRSLFCLNEERNQAFKIGLVSLFLCSLFLIIVQFEYSSMNVFYFPDEEKFFNASQHLSSLGSISAIFKESFSNAFYTSNSFAVFIMGTLGHICGENSVLLQRLSIVLFAFLIPVLLFKLGLNYVDAKTSSFCTLLFTAFSYVLPYSCFILRDIHVMFFSLVMLVLIHEKISMSTILFQLVTVIIVYFFRVESGVVVSVLFLYYIFIKQHDYSSKNLLNVLRFITVIAILASSKMAINHIQMALEQSTYYAELSLEESGATNAALTKVYTLPFGIRNIVIGIYSQMSPVPYWKALSFAKFPAIGLMYMANAVFWFFVNFVVVKYVFFERKIKLPSMLTFLYIFYLLFLCFASTEIEHRRLMCFYPIPYIIFMFFYLHIKQNIKTEFFNSLILYSVIGVLFEIMAM